ncbi:MAG: ROK family glucokinase [Lachnospiraceae bacterium]|jgi:glucokinase|nr:ROK family glucokinase [Lachnospiraceae bacterium]
MKKYCFGVDIGGTTVKMGLFDAEGTVLDKWEIPTIRENQGEAILPDTAKSINEKIKEQGLDLEEIAGIGVGVPCPVFENGSVPHTANLGWGYKEVTKELSQMTGLTCKAGNDANVAALGEMWMGGGKGCKNVLLITLGTGVGGGIVVDGKILTGAHGAGGEVGHIHMDDNLTEHCGCGNQGCLEQFASATGIVRLCKEILRESSEPSILREGEVTAKAVFDAVKEGDLLAICTAERFGKYLGSAIAIMASILDPEVIVIGGGVSKAGPVLLDYIKKYYTPRAFRSSKETAFALAELGNDAGIYGCAKLMLSL